jgi:hypothetical protein
MREMREMRWVFCGRLVIAVVGNTASTPPRNQNWRESLFDPAAPLPEAAAAIAMPHPHPPLSHRLGYSQHRFNFIRPHRHHSHLPISASQQQHELLPV